MSDELNNLKAKLDEAAQVGPKVHNGLAQATIKEQQAQNLLADATAARKKAEVGLESARLVENQAQQAMADATAARKEWEKRVEQVTESITGLSQILDNLKHLAGS